MVQRLGLTATHPTRDDARRAYVAIDGSTLGTDGLTRRLCL
jgi:hypothetical protein